MGRLMAYTPILGLSGASWTTGKIPDYFDPGWAARVRAQALDGTSDRSTDPQLVGYFIDNEMHWGPDWRTSNDLFDDFLQLPAAAPGKQALIQLLKERHRASIADFDSAWGVQYGSFDDLAAKTALPERGTVSRAADADRSAFISLAARRFFQVAAGAIRAGDPNHLILGVRFVAAYVPVEVLEAAGQYCDVISINDYEFILDPQTLYPPGEYHLVSLHGAAPLENFYKLTGRPVLVSEFGWRAADSGLPNSWPPIYPTLATQRDRADHFEKFARSLLAAPYVVGYHWFEWADEPASGRFDGENDNWGLVNAADDAYTEVTSRMAAVNRASPP